jgi:Tfp pilus assembly protein PilX
MEKYILRVMKKNYFQLDKTVYFSSLTLKNDNVRNYSTTAKAWVKMNFVNDPNFGGNLLEYTIQQGKENVEGCCQHGTYSITNSTSYYCINDGNKPYSYLYFTFGPNSTGIKSVITTPFDTTTLSITY